MLNIACIWWILLLILVHISESKIVDSDKLKAIKELRMGADQYKRVENLHLNMYARAMQSLIGAVGRETYKKLGTERAAKMKECLNGVDDNDLQAGAQCIVDSWNSSYRHKFKKSEDDCQIVESVFKTVETAFKTVESVDIQPKARQMKMTPRFLKYQNKKARKKRSYSNMADEDGKFKPKTMDTAPPLHSKYEDESLTSAGAKIFLRGMTTLMNKTANGPNDAFMNLQKLQKLVEIQSEARKYKNSLSDIILDKRGPDRRRTKASDRIKALMPNTNEQQTPIMNNLFNLMDSFEKHNTNLNYKFLSPKFGSVIQDQRGGDSNQILSMSPNIFPFYKDKNAVLPVPEMLESAGLSEKEQSAFMDLIIEASGASKLVEETMQLFENNNTRSVNDEINNVTMLMQERFNEIHSTLTEKQRNEMAKRDFTFLSRSQLEMLYGPKGLTPTNPFDFDEYESWNRVDLQKGLMQAVRSIADGQALSEANFAPTRRKRRMKRQLSPELISFGQPTLLAPFSFAPDILDTVVLGPTLLSPSIFSPGILSPFALSPVILSPSIGNPLILSPYVLSPKILSPEIFAVYILNPYLISPNILNPFVLSPLVLSPHLLCPDILSPTVASGIVLNPYALSPAILTESAFVFDILSPNILS